jgi:hypothetical protein
MKISMYSLARSRSEALFQYLKPLATALQMNIVEMKKGDYYYLKNTQHVATNTFLKIDARTDTEFFKKIVTANNDHHWFITTRDFEGFCLSLTYAIQRNKFHDKTWNDHEYTDFQISKEEYLHAKEIYNRHLAHIEIIKENAPNYSILHYDDIQLNTNTVHIEKDYSRLCKNYIQFRDWQRIDYIMSLEIDRQWNCNSTHHKTESFHKHPLFNDIVSTDRCYMWCNVYYPGDSQDWHTHDGVQSCGTRFLQVPENSGRFEFKDKQVENKEGTQIVFGPDDLHRVTKNCSNLPRITVSWNIR